MGNVQTRLPDDTEQLLDSLAGELRTSRSEVVRRALDAGLHSMLLDRAVQAYGAEEMTLSRAAEYAQVSIPRLVHEAAKRGTPVFRQQPEELDRDIEAIDVFFDEADPAPGAG